MLRPCARLTASCVGACVSAPGRYMLEAPAYRAAQSVPWLHLSAVWHDEAERGACLKSLEVSRQERAQQLAAEARKASKAQSTHPAQLAQSDHQGLSKPADAGDPSTRLPPSASGRQVFLAWLAQGSANAGAPAVAASAAAASAAATSAAALAAAAVGSTIDGPLIPSSAEPVSARIGVGGDEAVDVLGAALASGRRLRVYTDLPQLRAALHSDRFELVPERTESGVDIIWTGDHIRDFARWRDAPLPVLNQFPHESCLTAKNLLAECVHAKYGRGLPWLADTYTLPHELPAFVDAWISASQTDEAAASALSPEGAAPVATAPSGVMELEGGTQAAAANSEEGRPRFIVKPWNLSRSRGILLVDRLAPALASCCTAFGPRLACRYVARPLLLEGRKFDARMYVAVRSLSPPSVWLYRSAPASLPSLAHRSTVCLA